MVDHFVIVTLMASVAYGAHIVMGEEMILHGLQRLLMKAPKFLHKPLFACPPCMCSIWGIPVWIIAGSFEWYLLPIHLLAAAGIAAYMNK